jgi:hypothetical protein
MTTIAKYMEQLSDADKIQIIEEYEQFAKDGFIGTCKLRTVSREWIESLGGTDLGCSIVLTMNVVAGECFKYFAKKYLNDLAAKTAKAAIRASKKTKKA